LAKHLALRPIQYTSNNIEVGKNLECQGEILGILFIYFFIENIFGAYIMDK
jgi:hypothetical protein